MIKKTQRLCFFIMAAMLTFHTVSISAETDVQQLFWNDDFTYAEFSQIHTDPAILYLQIPGQKIIAVNAGHGTSHGAEYSTLCHPDGSAKVTGGSTSEGATYATAVSAGTTMLDGTPEADVTLQLAQILRGKLLDEGYNVLMLRDSDDTQLDNIARTVFANNFADCHISLHYDSTENDKGFFYIGVPNIDAYRSMEPVASNWEKHTELGNCLLEGMKQVEQKICGDGCIPLDLTQTSYSTIPSVDLEVGDRGSDHSAESLDKISEGIIRGLKLYYE